MAITASYSQAGMPAVGRTQPDAARSCTCLPIFAQHRRRPQDVGTGTTKANTAILHVGFDAVPGSLESRLLRRGSALLRRGSALLRRGSALLRRGSALLRDYAAQAGIPVERTGALLIA